MARSKRVGSSALTLTLTALAPSQYTLGSSGWLSAPKGGAHPTQVGQPLPRVLERVAPKATDFVLSPFRYYTGFLATPGNAGIEALWHSFNSTTPTTTILA